MSSGADGILALLQVFSNANDADQGWGDFGDEEGRKLLASFTEMDWIAFFDRRQELSNGSLQFLPFLLSDVRNVHADRLLVWLVITSRGWGWIHAADELGARLDRNPHSFEIDASVMRTVGAVAFVEAQLLAWLNFPYAGFARFEEYVRSYAHLLSPGVRALYSFVKHAPNKSLERTREG
jgi:hypothetical protein